MSVFGLSPELSLVWWTVVGLFVGSFLNVCIYRLPKEGLSVLKPLRSFCPSCGHGVTPRENIPVLSWLLQRGRCTACKWRIPARYPLVELTTGALWFLTCQATADGPLGLLLIRLVVVSGLIVATFVDFDCFEIPDEVSIGGMVLAPIASLLVPVLHQDTLVAQRLSEGESVDRFGALAGCLAGMAVGGGVLLLMGWVGKRLFGRDAMGLGDVKLLAAAGGFVGPGGVFVALVLASIVGSVAGVGNILRFLCFLRRRVRERGSRRSFGASVAAARVAGRYLPFGPYLALGIGIVLLSWNHVVGLIWGAL